MEAASSTKNKAKSRDPEMHQTKKGNQRFFGLKAHIGVDAKRGLVHSFTTTSANEHDLNQIHKLTHEDELFVSADSGYRGVEKRDDTKGLIDYRDAKQGAGMEEASPCCLHWETYYE